MEFFREVKVACSSDALQRALTIATLPRFCGEISKVLKDGGEAGEIYCLWGSFTVRRELIRNGVRFTLPGCPNALAWTVTCEADPGGSRVVVHCTINQPNHDADFIESIESFVEAWKRGLEMLDARISTAE